MGRSAGEMRFEEMACHPRNDLFLMANLTQKLDYDVCADRTLTTSTCSTIEDAGSDFRRVK